MLSRALPAAAEVVINLNALTGQLHPIQSSAAGAGEDDQRQSAQAV